MNNLLTDLADGNKAINDLRPLAKCDEDLLWGVLEPNAFKTFKPFNRFAPFNPPPKSSPAARGRKEGQKDRMKSGSAG